MFNNLHQAKMNISKSYIIILLNSFVYGSSLDAVSAFSEFYFEMNENRTSVLLFGCQINYVNRTLPSMPWKKISTDWQLLIFDIQQNTKQNKFSIKHRRAFKNAVGFFFLPRLSSFGSRTLFIHPICLLSIFKDYFSPSKGIDCVRYFQDKKHSFAELKERESKRTREK